LFNYHENIYKQIQPNIYKITMKRKAQAAMEYLMTYGWAILIVIIVAAALYALGVFNPATWTGTRSTGFANIGQPTDWVYDGSAGDFNITLKNSLGTQITISAVTAACGAASAEITLLNASSQTVGAGGSVEYYTNATKCVTLTSGSSYSTGIKVTYTKAGGTYSQTDTGTVTGSAI
jgi:hypothetical protein